MILQIPPQTRLHELERNMAPLRPVRKDVRSIEEASESSLLEVRNRILRSSPSQSISTRTSGNSLSGDDLVVNHNGISTMYDHHLQDDAAFGDFLRRRRMEYFERMSSRLSSTTQGSSAMATHTDAIDDFSSHSPYYLDRNTIDHTDSLLVRAQNTRERDFNGRTGLSSDSMISSSFSDRHATLDPYTAHSRHHELYEAAAAATTATNRAQMLYGEIGLSRGRVGMTERNQSLRLPEASQADLYGDTLAVARDETEEIIRNSRMRMVQGRESSVAGRISADPYETLNLLSSGRSHWSRNMLLDAFPYSTTRQHASYEFNDIVGRSTEPLEELSAVPRRFGAPERTRSPKNPTGSQAESQERRIAAAARINAETCETESVPGIRMPSIVGSSAYGTAMSAPNARITEDNGQTPVVNAFSSDEQGNETGPEHDRRKDFKVPFAQVWDDMVERLKIYKKEHGDCMVPWNYTKDRKLGSWISKQRHYYSSGSLSQDRIDSLSKLGFVWKVGKQVWDEMFERLKAYQQKHGDCLVPTHYKEDPKLGRWVYMQRTRKSKIEKDQVTRLESIGFRWSVHKAFWKEAKEKTQEKQADKSKQNP